MSGYTTTPNLGLFKPNYAQDRGQWGNHWNANADKLDQVLGPAGPFLPIAGGTITGNLTVNGTLRVGGTGPITGFGTAIGQAIGPLANRGGIPSVEHNGLLFNRVAPSNLGGSDFFVRRDGTGLTGGTKANLNQPFSVVQSVVSTDGSSNWTGLFSIASAGTGNALALYAQTHKTGTSLHQGWAFISEAADQTGLKSSLAGPIESQEMDVGASDLDDGANGTRFGGMGVRAMVHGVFSNQSPAKATITQFTAGIWMGTDTNVFVDSPYAFQPNSQIRQALDTRGAIPPTGSSDPVAAVRMSAGHILDFNGGAALNSAPGNYWWFDAGAAQLKYNVGNTTFFSIANATGATTVGGPLTMSGKLNMASIPTSPTGLVAGDVWRNGTVLNIV